MSVYDENRAKSRAKAIELLRVGWVRFAHEPEGAFHMVVLVAPDGMIELLDFSGRFHPDLFIPTTPPQTLFPTEP